MAVFYKGVAYPFQAGNFSIPSPVTDAELVKQSLQQILTTTRGERVMRPNFGCNLQRYVFENNNELLAQLFRSEISAAISTWEPRAALDSVSFERSDSMLTVTVLYTVVTTQTQDTIQVPLPIAGP